jgi:hypothetical protein
MTAQGTLEYLERLGRGMIGLLVSAGFGALVGIRTGALAGCVVGTIVPILGNFFGFFIGAGVGAIIGLPAGILCGACQGRNGCRLGGAVAALLTPLGYVVACDRGAVNGWSGSVSLVALVALAAVGAITGNWVWGKLETEAPGMFAVWAQQNERWGLYDLSLGDRLLSALLLTLPVWVFQIPRLCG